MHLKSSSHCLEPFNIPRWGKGAVNCIGIKFVCCGMHGGHDKDIYLFMKPSLAFNFNVWSLTIRKKKPKKTTTRRRLDTESYFEKTVQKQRTSTYYGQNI